MPFKSEKQRRYFHWAEAHGKLPRGTAEKWEEHTPKGEKLPERVEKTAFELGFEKRAGFLSPIVAKAKTLGSSIVTKAQNIGTGIAAKAPSAPSMLQKPMAATGNWISANPKKALGAAGGLAVAGAYGVSKALSGGQPKTASQLKEANFAHAAELAGLGVLAAPSASALAGHPWKEKNKDISDVAGLGVLAAPSIAHFVAKNKKLAPYLTKVI